ncbi:MAG: hypothetical protein EON59_14700 [Alphaproteobacteria bacterium]|nr:MAG: hypothetical protein EON59_14700 [Alphaproteobacteria bacterium]
MNALAENSPAELSPAMVARMALEACENIRLDATEWMVAYIRDNPSWASCHADEMARRWANDTVGREIMTASQSTFGVRRVGHAASEATVVPFQSALTEAVNSNFSRLMDSPIWGGKKIGDATPEEIRESARQFGDNGRTLLRKSRWQLAIADAAEKNGAGINEPVRKVLSPKTFEQLWEQTDAA